MNAFCITWRDRRGSFARRTLSSATVTLRIAPPAFVAGTPDDSVTTTEPADATNTAQRRYLSMTELAILGGGHMGSAIVRGAIRSNVLSASSILVVEPDKTRRAAIASIGCRTASESSAAAGAATIMLAVKPQSFGRAIDALPDLEQRTVVISIMAGLASKSIHEHLGDHAAVVRVMPNTPCQIGRGMSAVALGAGSAPGDQQLAVRLFSALGTVVEVPESLMHAVTAVSGSGPAYLFLLAEAMEKAAIELGFEPELARRVVAGTLTGASALLEETGADPAALRAAVTSPGGTTEAAIRVMEIAGVPEAMQKAIASARDRGAELEVS